MAVQKWVQTHKKLFNVIKAMQRRRAVHEYCSCKGLPTDYRCVDIHDSYLFLSDSSYLPVIVAAHLPIRHQFFTSKSPIIYACNREIFTNKYKSLNAFSLAKCGRYECTADCNRRFATPPVIVFVEFDSGVQGTGVVSRQRAAGGDRSALHRTCRHAPATRSVHSWRRGIICSACVQVPTTIQIATPHCYWLPLTHDPSIVLAGIFELRC